MQLIRFRLTLVMHTYAVHDSVGTEALVVKEGLHLLRKFLQGYIGGNSLRPSAIIELDVLVATILDASPAQDNKEDYAVLVWRGICHEARELKHVLSGAKRKP